MCDEHVVCDLAAPTGHLATTFTTIQYQGSLASLLLPSQPPPPGAGHVEVARQQAGKSG